MESERAEGPAVDVLLVDDDPSSLAMLALALRRAGLTVVACSNPNAALERLRRERFRCLVTDAHMSPQDGFALADAAKKARPELRIVMISALASAEDIRGHPIEQVFPKPVALDALTSWVWSFP